MEELEAAWAQSACYYCGEKVDGRDLEALANEGWVFWEVGAYCPPCNKAGEARLRKAQKQTEGSRG